MLRALVVSRSVRMFVTRMFVTQLLLFKLDLAAKL
jgi:hypothetical protein